MNRGLTIATPCYDEADSLPAYFERIGFVRDRLEASGWSASLLLINDGSRDRTPELLEAYAPSRPGTRVFNHPRNLGYTAAMKTALALAATDWVVFVDADTNYDQAIILEMARRVTDATDLINVSIFAPGGKPAYPWYRRFFSMSASLIYRAMLPRLTRGIYTMTCGFRWYRRSVAASVFPRTDTFVGTAEIMLRALQAGLRVEELPAANADRRHGASKMRFVRESLAHLRLAARAFAGRLGPPLPIEEHLRRIGADSAARADLRPQ